MRLPGVRRIELEPLADADVIALVRSQGADELGNESLLAVVRRAAGNAFFAEELLDAGLADADAALPETLADLLLMRLDRLDDHARRLVRAAACSDARHDYAVLSKVVGLPEEQLDDALRSAIDHKVLTRLAATTTYQFRHALLGEAIRDDLLPGERRRIHAAYLEALTTGDPRGPAAEIAHHALGAGQRETAFVATIEAAEAPQRLAGYDEAAQHYEQALTLLDAAPGDFDAMALVIDASAALVTSGRLLRAVELLRDHLAQLPADVSAEARGRLLVAIGNTTYYANLDMEAEEASAEAARIVPDEATVLRAEVAALHARTSSSRGRYDEAIQWGERALAIAEQIEAADVIADAKATLTRVMVRRGDDPEKAKQGFVELVESSRARATSWASCAVCTSSGSSPSTRVPSTQPTRRSAAAWRAPRRPVGHGVPYGFDGRFLAALVCYMRGRWDEVLELGDVGPDAPALADALLGAIALMVAAGRARSISSSAPSVVAALWRHEVAAAIHSTSALIELHGVAGDLVAARRSLDDLVELHTRGLGRSRVPRTHPPGRVGDRPVRRPRPSRSAATEQSALLEHAAELVAIADRVAEHTSALGPEGQAWLVRAHAEHARLRWLCGVDAPPSATR